MCKTPPKNKCTPNCSQHTLIFKLKCNSLSDSLSETSSKHLKHPPKHSKHGQNIRNTAKTFETRPKHSKHPKTFENPHNIRNTPTTFERTRGHGQTDTKDGQLFRCCPSSDPLN